MSRCADLNRGPTPSLIPFFIKRRIKGLDCILSLSFCDLASLVSRSSA